MSIISTSCIATAITALYISIAIFNFYKIMNPLFLIDIKEFPTKEILHPYWNSNSNSNSNANSNGNTFDNKEEYHQIKVYLSTLKRFDMTKFLSSDDDYYNKNSSSDITSGGSSDSNYNNDKNVVLLWDDIVPIENSGEDKETKPIEIKKELVLSIGNIYNNNNNNNNLNKNKDGRNIVINETIAKEWFNEGKTEDDLFENSWIVTGLRSIANYFSFLIDLSSPSPDTDTDTDETTSNTNTINDDNNDNIIKISNTNPIWKSLIYNNRTVYIHALVIRHLTKPSTSSSSSTTLSERIQTLQKQSKTHSIVSGQVTMMKHDLPIPMKPKRLLINDIIYFYEKYILSKNDNKPWDLSKSTNEQTINEYNDYVISKKDKELNIVYPYWKPEVSIRLISDTTSYPYAILQQSYPIIQVPSTQKQLHTSGYAYLPPIHVDEIGLTSDKYIPLNKTITALPLRISFDSYTLTPQRWRLLSHFSHSLNQQKSGVIQMDNEDIDEFRHLIADTNVTLLCIILLASMLHLLFEFLTFKNDVSFWKDNKDITGLSIRALFSDTFCQFIITLYLIEKNSSLLVTVPSSIGVLIALWKCYKGAGLAFVKASGWFFGYELQATRLRKQSSLIHNNSQDSHNNTSSTNLAQLTIEMDKLATNTLSIWLLPPLLSYAIYSLFTTPYTSWYSYLITITSSFVYGLGFIFMTPQLFLNYKLKSVAHLPWKVLVYKFLNTFIDDLFALVIRMPTMAKIGVFRDDIVFFIYLGQRWYYDVDLSRPVEGGGDGGSAVEDEVVQEKDMKMKKDD